MNKILSEPLGRTASLVCRVRQKQSGNGPIGLSSTAGELELENVSSDTIEIEWQMNPLQYLNLLVTDCRGAIVSESHYGDQFSPQERPSVLRLHAGEKYIGNVSLLGNVPKEKQLPGSY